jgi:uroporphyrinogen-III decarboxylase
MDLGKIKDTHRNKICLIGGIKNDVICYGNPEDVRNEVKRVISIAGKGGGYIPALGSGDYRNEMPLENIMAVIKTIKEYK